MSLYQKILSGEEKLSLVGLGYVGMPIAVAFSKKVSVVGFDVNEKKIQLYKKGIDPTREVGDQIISGCAVEFTSDETKLREAIFHIVAVPTPVNEDHSPNLAPVESASRIVGRNLRKGCIVVYESTVYPGVTEEICVPILEKESGLKCGIDFKVGYSPERINPSDREHRLDTIIKIVSGQDQETLDMIAKIYELVVTAGVYRAETIKVAEAAKVIENSQRDINVAFMNELSLIFNKMGIDTRAVLKAAGTKWNFLNFTPGLVGGHCIGVDPYYLTYCAEKIGYHSQVILSGRRINDGMGKYIAENLVKKLVQTDIPLKKARVAVMGLAFKENCPDMRNTKVLDILSELREYGIEAMVIDPVVESDECEHEYGLQIYRMEDISDLDAVVIAVAHDTFCAMNPDEIERLFVKGAGKNKIIFDIKGIFEKDEFLRRGYNYWRL